jgi:hypothetical protein
MLKDHLNFNAKGHVKLELYNESGDVYFTKEKKNLVVLSANAIVGEAFADPARKVLAKQVDKGVTAVVADALEGYVFDLSLQEQADATYATDLGSTNIVTDIHLDAGQIVSLKKVTVGGVELVIDEDVFIKDPDQGILTFAAAPIGQLSVEYRKTVNPYVEIVPGSEVVKVGGTTLSRGKVASDAKNKYAIDYKTGKVFFETARSNVEVSYNFKVRYSLGFMGLGGKPAGHPDYKPVEFSEGDKLKVNMDNEFIGCRQLLQFPASVGVGEPEIDVFPTAPMSKKTFTDPVTGINGSDTYSLTSAAGKPVIAIVSVKDVTDPANPVDLTANVKIKDAKAGTVQFTPAPVADNKYEVIYDVRDDVNYTYYSLSQAPVMELVSVKHEDLDNHVTEYKINNKGLVNGDGDVWILNPNKGIIQFSTNPSTGVGVETPGQLTFEYRINSGTTVRFIADFPKGVPGPVVTDQIGEVIPLQVGQTAYALQHAIAKDNAAVFYPVTVKKGSTTLVNGTDYDLSQDGTQIVLKVAFNAGDSLTVDYKWLKDNFDIYQVAMYAEQTDGKMFNISGIGPVTKDKNTGMRITWSVTF